MTGNLETADTIVKLVLAIAVLISYFAHIITGPFATALMILSVIVVLIFVVRFIIARMFMD